MKRTLKFRTRLHHHIGISTDMRLRFLVVLAICTGCLAQSNAAPAARKRTVTKVAEHVFLIQHVDATEDWPESNTILVVGRDAALVIDSGYLPSTARGDILEILRLTDRPVQYLLNTHWHYDHNGGNGVYAQEFPGLRIVAQQRTAAIMDANVSSYAKRTTQPDSQTNQELAHLKQRLESRKDETGRPLTDSDLAALTSNIAARENELKELAIMQYAGPNLVFEHRLDIDLGGEIVTIHHLGRANTPGDAIVFLPAEKVLLTGDVVVAPVPYTFNCFPTEWAKVLRRLKAFNATTIIPGHGEIQHDLTYANRVAEMLEYTVARAALLLRDGTKGNQTSQLAPMIDLSAFRSRFAGSDPKLIDWFEQTVQTPLPKRAIMELTGQF
jgi:cyclase